MKTKQIHVDLVDLMFSICIIRKKAWWVGGGGGMGGK